MIQREHIYRRHRRPIHCRRCWTLFGSQELLKSHLREKELAQKCEEKSKKALDSIAPETELLLRSRKDYKGKSEAERWKKMYRTLFPDWIVPSRCK